MDHLSRVVSHRQKPACVGSIVSLQQFRFSVLLLLFPSLDNSILQGTSDWGLESNNLHVEGDNKGGGKKVGKVGIVRSLLSRLVLLAAFNIYDEAVRTHFPIFTALVISTIDSCQSRKVGLRFEVINGTRYPRNGGSEYNRAIKQDSVDFNRANLTR